MVRLNVIYDEFRHYDASHHRLKTLFNNFQKNIDRLMDPEFPVSGIAVQLVNTDISRIIYIGRVYEFRFSADRDDDTLIGSISVHRQTVEGHFRELGHVTFDEDSVVNIKSPDCEISQVRLDNPACCCAVALNFIRDDINS